MKVTYFQQLPYRQLPDDFVRRHESVVTTPYHDLVGPKGARAVFGDALEELMHAARAGFDGLAVTEHSQTSFDVCPNPDLLAAALAYATEAEGLQTAVYPLGRSLGKSREPLRVAEEQAMLDCMTGGRLVSGFPIGLAYDANINNGVPPIDTRARYEENLELVLRAWTAREPFTFNGRFSQHRAVNIWPRPLQDPHPPVWITATGNPRTMEYILRSNFGFNYFGWFGARLTGPRIFRRFREIADRLGIAFNPYRIGFMQVIAVAENDAQAEAQYARHVEYFFRNAIGAMPLHRLLLPGGVDPRGVEALLTDPGDTGVYATMRTATYRELVDAGCVIAGSPDSVTEQLVDIARDFGFGNLHAMLQFGSLPTDLTKANIDLFAAEVLPRLRGVWQDEGHAHHWWPRRLGGEPTPAGATLTAGGTL
jgi:alkanesulfonate monooxygenase SsuD/methylene tetrahydromethanopterin reductase-like flavin-dependent oxidoreductase (luciferase family)